MASPSAKYNWTAAFVAYVNNHPIAEISAAFGIPEGELVRRISAERWGGLRDELPLGTYTTTPAPPNAVAQSVGPADPFNQGKAVTTATTLPVAIKQKFEELIANRHLNLKQAQNLRTYLDGFIAKLLTGEMKMEQIFHNKGQIVRTLREISPADLVNIATFARSVHDMTYKALGDTTAQTERGQDGPVGVNSAQAPQIIINLPSAIAQPRQQAAALQEAKRAGIQIIDVASEVSPELQANEQLEKNPPDSQG